MYAPKTRIRIRTLTGPAFSPEWKETGTVMKPRACNLPMPDGYNLIRFDAGGSLCVHDSSLMADNVPA